MKQEDRNEAHIAVRNGHFLSGGDGSTSAEADNPLEHWLVSIQSEVVQLRVRFKGVIGHVDDRKHAKPVFVHLDAARPHYCEGPLERTREEVQQALPGGTRAGDAVVLFGCSE